ncbi:hypothetical protein [Paenibacillus thiaminolyticus]|nr:hypothetical protein [Paenibacillus thiaminolyticus]WII37316.1 hypothetical protein O0V01_27675 [Paenibacillus thiaminolyticus]
MIGPALRAMWFGTPVCVPRGKGRICGDRCEWKDEYQGNNLLVTD